MQKVADAARAMRACAIFLLSAGASSLPVRLPARPLPCPRCAPPAMRARPPPTRTAEVVLTKGAASLVVARLVSLSPWRVAALVPGALALGVVLVSQPGATQAVLIASLLWITGAATYWPINLLALLIGMGGAVGCLHGGLTWLDERMEARRAARFRPPTPRSSAERRVARDPDQGGYVRRADPVPEDGSASTLALLLGFTVAAIVGALP